MRAGLAAGRERQGADTVQPDRTLTCRSCRMPFVFTADEQAFFRDRGFRNVPRDCPPCRRERKLVARIQLRGPQARRPAAAAGFPARCAACGRPARVPFEPDPARPAFCRECYSIRFGSPAGPPAGPPAGRR